MIPSGFWKIVLRQPTSRRRRLGWLLFFVFQILVIIAGVRRERRAGLWSGSKFLFTLFFAALECSLLIIPILTMNTQSRYFIPGFTAAAIIAALNFIWFIIACRRWRLPDGRTSLEASRDIRGTDDR
jgi:hypothetical protein